LFNKNIEAMTNKNVDPSYLACPIRQVISRFGDKWSMLVLYSLHNSETGVLRFSELHKHMTDCSQKMLSSTLKNLEQYNLIHREVYPVVPPRVEYSLTDTGKSLMPAISSLIDWANLHFDDVVTKQIL
jgi:putative HTH-type transcriptional activator hxlR